MTLFRFTLDGNILADEPEGWQDIVSELKRDKESRGQLLLMDLTLRFNGNTDGYNILKPLIDCQGFCSFSELTIEQSCNNDSTWVTIFEGILFYTQVKEYLSPCVLECQLTDNSYFAKIDNNQSVDAYINAGRSKNNETITAATQTTIEFFDPNSPLANYGYNVYCWTVDESFRYIIDYMTDGEMSYVSDYFGTGGAYEGLYITTGQQIRLGVAGGSSIYPFISFETLFAEVNKKFNIGFSIEDVGGVKTMRIEPMAYFYNSGTSATISNARGIVKSVNTAELYAKLLIGSTETIAYSLGQTDFPTGIAFAGFNDESFTLTGKCNVDTELNLVSDWIIDSNVIQDVLVNGNSGYDESIFFVMADNATLKAIKYDPFLLNIIPSSAPYFYNSPLRNNEVALRWLGAVPNSIALYLGNGNDEFRAENTIDRVLVDSTPLEPVPFDDDFTPPNFDTNNNYNPAATFYRYTAPATGLFTFHARVFLRILSNSADQISIYGLFRSYTAAAVPIADFYFYPVTTITSATTPTTLIMDGSQTIYLQTGEYVDIEVSATTLAAPANGFRILANSYFECTASSTGGGVFQTYNPEDFKAYLYDFEYPITFADYQTIIANPLKRLAFDDGVNFISAWIDKMQYSHREGKAKFTCINSLPKTDC